MNIIIQVILRVIAILVKIGMQVMKVHQYIGKLIDVLLVNHIPNVKIVMKNKDMKIYIFLINHIIVMDVYLCVNNVIKIKLHLKIHYVISV